MLEGEITNELTKPTFDLDVEVKLPKDMPIVEHNLDKLEEYALNLNEWYSKLVIQESDIKNAESEKAKLNKLIDQVKRLRIDNVKAYKKPIEDFESTAKRVESILGEAADTIKSTLDIYEEKRKNEKYENIIKPLINSAISESFIKGHFINPERIEENSKWYNKTYKEEDIAKDIQDQVDEIIRDEESLKQGIEVIKSNIAMANNDKLNTEMYIERFKYSRDLTAVLNDIARDNNVSHETSEPKLTMIVNDAWETSNVMTKATFMGSVEQISKLRAYAKELGMEEI